MIPDVHYALRGFLKRPAFTAIAVGTLALGIGAGTTIFSVVNGVLFRSLPYQDPDQLVSIRVNSGIGSTDDFYDLSEPELIDLDTQISSFAEVAGYAGTSVTMGDSVSPRRIRVMLTTADLLPMLGVSPLLGRTFSAGEDQPGSPRVVMLSYGMWQGEFGGDPDIVGRAITLAEQPVTIVGVMPSGFQFPTPDWDVWATMRLDRANPWARNNHYLPAIARLAPGVTLEMAQGEVNVLARRSTADYPDFYPNEGYRIRLERYQDVIVGSAKTPLYILLGAVAFVLLTACVNVANLLLARGEIRKREIAIRAAIGASSRRVMGQLLTESFLLAGFGALAGLGIAFVGVEALLALAPESVPRRAEIRIDALVLGFSLLTALGTGLLFGIIPAVHATKQDVQEMLKEGGARGGKRSGHRLRRVLVATQVIFAVILTTGSGLMLRTVLNMYQVDMGFRTDNILTFRLNPSSNKYNTQESRVAFYGELLERINALPGVTSAGAAYSPPLTGRNNNWSIIIDGRPVANVGEAPAELVQRVTPEYFDVLGLQLVRGRLFTRFDVADARPVVIVSESMARKHWPAEDAIGKRMRVFAGDPPWMEVIGIVKDVRHTAPHREPRPRWYVPYAQAYVTAYSSPIDMTVVVGSDSDPIPLMASVRRVVAETDPSVPISFVQTMDQVLDGALGTQRFVATLLSVFGLLALFLAAVGVYGIMSYAVSQRTQEIGLRMALGARGRNVLFQVVREGLILSLIGVSVGLAGSVALSRGFRSVVFGISTTDPLTYAGVVVVLVAVAAGASLIPARRASQVSPVEALRGEA